MGGTFGTQPKSKGIGAMTRGRAPSTIGRPSSGGLRDQSPRRSADLGQRERRRLSQRSRLIMLRSPCLAERERCTRRCPIGRLLPSSIGSPDRAAVHRFVLRQPVRPSVQQRVRSPLQRPAVDSRLSARRDVSELLSLVREPPDCLHTAVPFDRSLVATATAGSAASYEQHNVTCQLYECAESAAARGCAVGSVGSSGANTI